MKEETRKRGPYTFGSDEKIPSGQGARTDLELIQEAITDGAAELEIADNFFSQWVRYRKSFAHYRLIKSKPRDQRPLITTYVGPTGTGKTFAAYEQAKAKGTFYVVPSPKSGGLTYWDGYQCQDTVIVDEMSGSRFHWTFLLQLLDERPFMVPVHGAQVNFNSPNIIFCSNTHPQDWYDQQKSVFQWEGGPLQRRLTEYGNKIVKKEQRYRQRDANNNNNDPTEDKAKDVTGVDGRDGVSHSSSFKPTKNFYE